MEIEVIFRFKMSIHIPIRYIYEGGDVAGLGRRCGDTGHWAPVAASPALPTLAPGLHLHHPSTPAPACSRVQTIMSSVFIVGFHPLNHTFMVIRNV